MHKRQVCIKKIKPCTSLVLFIGPYVGFTCGVLTSNPVLMGVFLSLGRRRATHSTTAYPFHKSIPTPQHPTQPTTAYLLHDSLSTPLQPINSTIALYSLHNSPTTISYSGIPTPQPPTHSTTACPLYSSVPAPQQPTHTPSIAFRHLP